MSFSSVFNDSRGGESIFEVYASFYRGKGLAILTDDTILTIDSVGKGNGRNCSVLHSNTIVNDATNDHYDKVESCRLTKTAAYFEIEGRFYRMDFDSVFETRDFSEHGYTSLVEVDASRYPSFRPSCMLGMNGSFLQHTSFGIREVKYNCETSENDFFSHFPVTVEGHGTYIVSDDHGDNFHYIGSNIISGNATPIVLSSGNEVIYPSVYCRSKILGVFNDNICPYIAAVTPWGISITWFNHKESVMSPM